MHPVTQKIKQANHVYRFFRTGEPILIGVSGGPDSVTLLHVLLELRQEWGIRLHIAHVDHGLRPTARRDQEFVRTLAKKKNIPFYTTVVKVSRKRGKSSIEEHAREERFKFFFQTAKKEGIKTIALGHTQDDLAETVLMRILRGSGLHGLQSILPKRELNGFWIVRPLIHTTRSEVLRYLRRNKIPYRMDPSNLSTQYFRNKIRLRLLPMLTQYNPNIKELLANLALNAAIDYSFLSAASRKHFKTIATISPNSVKLKLNKLRKLHQSIQRNMVRQAIESINSGAIPLTSGHVKAIEEMIQDNVKDSIITLPGNKIRVTCNGPEIIISR